MTSALRAVPRPLSLPLHTFEASGEELWLVVQLVGLRAGSEAVDAVRPVPGGLQVELSKRDAAWVARRYEDLRPVLEREVDLLRVAFALKQRILWPSGGQTPTVSALDQVRVRGMARRIRRVPARAGVGGTRG